MDASELIRDKQSRAQYGCNIATYNSGAAGAAGATGSCFSDYLYWNSTNWAVGSTEVHIGCLAGQNNQINYFLIAFF